jgi:hypothetical protein
LIAAYQYESLPSFTAVPGFTYHLGGCTCLS